MFTGIIETIGKVESLKQDGSNRTFLISSNIFDELRVDQSIAHDGVCLTIESLRNKTHQVSAIRETLDRSNLGRLAVGDFINLERCLRVGDRLDGHMVQGHVDDTGICFDISENDGSWTFTFEYDSQHTGLLIPKGSIAVNGASLTLVDVTDSTFSVAIIPFTYEHTTFRKMRKGDIVNLEFDILGKYVVKNLSNLSKT